MSRFIWWLGLLSLVIISFWQWKTVVVVLLYGIFSELVTSVDPTNNRKDSNEKN